MTVRTLGMGSVASADPNDGTNAWANPSVFANLDDLESAICYRAYSVSTVDFSDFSALLGGSYSAARFRAAAGVAYHRETLETGTNSETEDAYHLLIAGQVPIRQLTFAVGFAQKFYSLPAVADEDRNSVADIGLLAAWKSPTRGNWHFNCSAGYSWMNNGDEVQTKFFGPIQLVTTERYGVWFAAHSPTDKDAIFGNRPVSLFELSAAFDVDRTTSRGEHSRYLFGSEVALWNAFFVHGGYVHDEVLADGARDASFGAGVRFLNSQFRAQVGYARFPVMHDLYSNTFGAELSLIW